MRNITTPIRCFFRAHRILWSDGMWKLMAIPVLLSAVYFPLLVWLCFLGTGTVNAWLIAAVKQYEAWGEALRYLVNALALGGFLVLGFLSYRAVVMIFYAPFLDHIAQRIEEQVRARPVESEKSVGEMVGRVIGVSALTVAASIGLLVAGFACTLIPVVGLIVPAILVPLAQIFLHGFGYLDPVFERSGFSVRESLRTLGRHKKQVLVFSLSSMVLTSIPLLGWVLGPTYTVVAGVLLGLRIIDGTGER